MIRLSSDVFDWIDGITSLKSSEDVWKSFMAFSGRYGFVTGALADLPGPHKSLRDTTLTWSWPEQWRERYLAAGYVRIDPTVKALGHTIRPYTWKESLTFERYGEPEYRIFDEAKEFAMHDGFVVPITGIRTGTALLTLTGPATEMSDRERAAMHLTSIYAHLRIRDLLPALEPPDHAMLTMRERECLQWAAIGKSDWEIGEILSISSRTAGAHMKNVARKFGVRTRVQAVVQAIHHQDIHI